MYEVEVSSCHPGPKPRSPARMSASGPSSCRSEHAKQAAGDSSSESEPTAVASVVQKESAASGRARPAAVALPRHASSDSIFTPPGSPGGFHKELSVQELYQSARASFGGELQPQKGDLVALEHPVRRGPTRMVTEQEWSATEGKAVPAVAAVAEEEEEEEEEEPWRPPSPQPSPPRVRSAISKLPSCFKEEDEEEEDEEVENEEVEDEEEEEAKTTAGARQKVPGTESEITVVSSAPGKVILFGEHAVVYGKTAVGAAVSDLRIVVTASCTREDSLVVELPDLDVCLRRTSQQIAAAFGFSLAVAHGAKAAPPGPAHLDLISAFLGDEDDHGWSKEGKKALVPLVFLALSLVPDIFLGKAGSGARGLSLTAFSASLPVGAGLGSSAALCVATSAALTRLSDAISRGESGDAAAAAAPKGEGVGMCDGVENGCDRRPPPCELERINAWAFAGETVLHGTPSGLDNTVSCYGGAIRFVKGMDGAANATEPIPGFPPLPILLTNTLVPKNTRALVAGVRRLLEAHRAPTAATFDAIGAIAAEFVERAAGSAAAAAPAGGGILGDGGDGGGAEAGSLPLTAECVGELAEMNHRLLCALGVGHPALERVCEVSNAHGCKSKLTGAGGGGCALTILLGEDLRKAALVKDMAAEGFKCYESSLGGDGVLWHGDTVPPEFLAAAAAAVEEGGRGGGIVEARSEESGGFFARLADRKGKKELGIAAAAAVTVAAVVPVVVAGFGRRGSRW